MIRNKTLLLLIAALFGACSKPGKVEGDHINEPDVEEAFEADKTFPKVESLGDRPGSIFLETLESEVDLDKNNIYAASLMMCWEEIKNKLDNIHNIESPALKLMNRTTTHENVLRPNEYSSSILMEDSVILAKAYFKKSLPFYRPLARFEEGMDFKGTRVSCFGFDGEPESARIYYYNSDNDFALRFFTKDKDHEMFMVKTDFARNKSIKSYINDLISNHETFRAGLDEHNYWRNSISGMDMGRIPMFSYNLETNFASLEGTKFYSNTMLWQITKAYQRTAFVLNEKGAEVESEAEMLTEAAEEPMEVPEPKKLVFDKNFLIILKRKDSANPYFAMYVANPELMQTE